MRFLSRIGLQYRIAGGVVLGLVALFSLFGFLAVRAINESKDVALEERLALAQSTARAVDALVEHAAAQLEGAARLDTLGSDDPEEKQIRWVYQVFGTFSTIARLDADGQVQWHYPELPGEEWAFAGEEQLLAGVDPKGTAMVQLTASATGPTPVAMIVTPIRGDSDSVEGFLAGELHLSHQGLDLVPLGKEGETGHAEVVDASGRIIAHPEGSGFVQPELHAEILAPLIAAKTAGTRIHHPAEGGDHIVAYYPLEMLAGGVVVEQSEDEALALPRDMERTVLIFGLGALVVSSGAAWVHARGVVRPIRELTGASKRIAAGSLDDPIVATREDEVGELARSFDTMRVKLRDSLEESRRWTEELEKRVSERTRELESLNRSRAELLGKVISAQEEERKRIARELHDESAQAVATLLVELQAMEESLPASAREAKRRLGRVKSQTTKALTDMRQIILDLRPSVLDELGLVAAVRWYARTRLESTRASVSVNVGGQQKRLPGSVETAMFRIAQEAINNVVRHAEASEVRVQLEFTDDRISLLVEDDGKGFDATAATRTEDGRACLGLAGMSERATLLGGSVAIKSELGRGTRVRVELPTVGETD